MGIDLREYEVSADREELALIIGKYAIGDFSLGQAASEAGISRFQMQEILHESNVELRLGPKSREEALDEVKTALEY